MGLLSWRCLPVVELALAGLGVEVVVGWSFVINGRIIVRLVIVLAAEVALRSWLIRVVAHVLGRGRLALAVPVSAILVVRVRRLGRLPLVVARLGWWRSETGGAGTESTRRERASVGVHLRLSWLRGPELRSLGWSEFSSGGLERGCFGVQRLTKIVRHTRSQNSDVDKTRHRLGPSSDRFTGATLHESLKGPG